jgi:hypothetical protein
MKRAPTYVLYKTLLLVIAGFFLLSCEKKTDYTLNEQPTIQLVVDGRITNEKKAHCVKLSLPFQSLNERAKPASGAIMSIRFNATNIQFHEDPANSGIYYSDSVFRGATGILYTLHILFNNQEYTATSSMRAATPMESLKIESATDSAGFYQLSYTESVEASMMEVLLDWTTLPQYASIEVSKRLALLTFYTLKTVDVSQIFKPDQEKTYFPKGTKILRRKYSLNDDEQKMIRSLLLETEWRGGRFDVIPDNVYTNLSSGAAGYFGAYTVVSDSTIIQ